MAPDELIRKHHDAQDFARATAVLLERLGPEISNFLRARLRDRVAAEDAFAEFSQDVWCGLPGFRWNCSVRVWAYTLARHAMLRCAKRAERHRRREVPLSHAGVLERAAPASRSRTHPALQSQSREHVARLFQTLPDEDQLLLTLRLTRRLDWKEIAQITAPARPLDQEAARLRKRFHLIKQRLRRLVRSEPPSVD